MAKFSQEVLARFYNRVADAELANVSFGSLADLAKRPGHVRSYPRKRTLLRAVGESAECHVWTFELAYVGKLIVLGPVRR